jgi:hypothetical protein
MITTNTTVRWSDPNGEPLVGVVVSVDGDSARVATPYGLTLTVAVERLKPMQSRLNIQPDSIRWEQPKNPAAVALQALRKTKTGGRNGGRPKTAQRCPCGAMTLKRAEQRNHRC